MVNPHSKTRLSKNSLAKTITSALGATTILKLTIGFKFEFQKYLISIKSLMWPAASYLFQTSLTALLELKPAPSSNYFSQTY